MSVTDEIFKTIDIAIDSKIKGLLNTDVAGIIEESADNGAYTVIVDKVKYTVPNCSGMSFKRGDLVWLHSPNGDFNKKFIIASRSGNAKSYANDSGSDYGGGGGSGAGSITSRDIITDEEIDEMFL